MTTVANNKTKYTNNDYRRAQLARKALILIDRPSHKDFLSYLENNAIKNCPINRNDAMAALDIFGKDLVSILPGQCTHMSTCMYSYEYLHAYVDLVLPYVKNVPESHIFIKNSRFIAFFTC